MDDNKVYENRLRRMAERQGLKVEKSRRRDTWAMDYGLYRIIDPYFNMVVAGSTQFPFEMTLEEVERWLTWNDERREPPQKAP